MNRIQKWVLNNLCPRYKLIVNHKGHMWGNTLYTERFWTYKKAMATYEDFHLISHLYVWAGFGWLKIREKAK